jgi:hypothetical protein
MLTEHEIRELLASYIPPYHHEIRDEICDKIISCGEQVLESVQRILDDDTVKDRQKALLESALWQIGGELIKDFFIKKAEYDLGSRLYIKKLPREELLQLRETNSELLKKVFNYLPEEIISFCASRQYQINEELQRLGLSVPEESFDIGKEQQLNPHLMKECPVCGKTPDKHSWLYFWTPNNDWANMRGRAGWIGLCKDCSIQASWVIREMN